MSKSLQIYTNYFKVDINRDIFRYDIIMSEGDPVKHKSIVT